MTTGELLAELRSRGVALWAAGGRLRAGAPKGLLTPAVRAALLACKGEFLEILQQEDATDPEVSWRAAAMQHQMPPEGAIPLLVAREAPHGPGRCLSCGDDLPEDHRARCLPCQHAAWQVVRQRYPELVLPQALRTLRCS